MQYQRYGALGFAVVQAVGQCFYVRPYVEDFSLPWWGRRAAAAAAQAEEPQWLVVNAPPLFLVDFPHENRSS